MALDILALHLLGDYILQTEWMAQNKLKSVYARLVHVNVYAFPFLIWGAYFYGLQGVFFYVGVWITHFEIDSFRFYADHPWPPKSILIDQSLHIITLAILARMFLG